MRALSVSQTARRKLASTSLGRHDVFVGVCSSGIAAIASGSL
jgi:hypothetical protein